MWWRSAFLLIGAGAAAAAANPDWRAPLALALAAAVVVALLWLYLRRRTPRAGGRCPMEKDKVVFATRADARRSVERSRRRPRSRKFSTPLDHEYHCPHYDHWHVSSQPPRR